MDFSFTYNNTVRVCPKNINNVSLELKIDKLKKKKLHRSYTICRIAK